MLNLYDAIIEDLKKKKKILFQKKAYSLGIKCPKILDYYWYNNSMYIIMEYIQGKDLASLYGTDPKKIPIWVWNKIHDIIESLYLNDIEYSDITAYNFIQSPKAISEILATPTTSFKPVSSSEDD